jgi:hypothetical protein
LASSVTGEAVVVVLVDVESVELFEGSVVVESADSSTSPKTNTVLNVELSSLEAFQWSLFDPLLLSSSEGFLLDNRKDLLCLDNILSQSVLVVHVDVLLQ